MAVSSFTYEAFRGAEQAAKDRDYVRFRLGDTDECSAILDDNEIAYALDQQPNRLLAAAECCRAVLAHLARISGMQVDRVIYADSAKYYENLEKTLRQEAARSSVAPYAGGISVSDKESRESNTDRVKPSFTRNTQVPPVSPFGLTQSDPSWLDE